MSIPGSASPLFFQTAAAAAGFSVNRSLRFNSGDSANLSRTPSSAGNRDTWTFSAWVKKSVTGNVVSLIGVGTSSTNLDAIDYQDECLRYTRSTGGTFKVLKTNAVFRDPSAWYHVVVAVDTTQSTSSNRVKIYVNGVQQTSFSDSTYPDQNEDTFFNSTNAHTIGRRNASQSDYFDGYMAEINFIDGQALAPTDFGEFDDNNVWQPKAYSGTYGTNGFYLDFSDNSSNAALGTDSSGNSNTWTVNNLVATAGLETAAQGFDVVTYTGNGSTQTIGGLAFQPDLLWIKSRSTAYSHRLFDRVRGTDALYPDITDAEGNNSINENLISYNSDGFTVGSTSGINALNNNGTTFVAWAWKAGGTAVSNTDGTITSSVSANTTYGFSIVSYNSGSSSGNYTLGHGLNAAPKFIIHKTRSSGNWWVYHESVIDNMAKYLQLNSSNALATNSAAMWGAAAPTSSVFGVRVGDLIGTSQDAIAYCWSEVPGFSKFGSYTGNGSSQTITTGFKPAYVLLKSTSTGSWIILDNKLLSGGKFLVANSSAGEDTVGAGADFTSDGFSLNLSSSNFNANGTTYIFAAFADKPPGEIIDSLIDTPTNYEAGSGNNGGNYCTWNPLDTFGPTFANGNLDASYNTTSWKGYRATTAVTSGKWYWEVTINTLSGSNYTNIGVSKAIGDGGVAINNDFENTAETAGYNSTGAKVSSTYGGGSYGATFTAGDVIGVALDVDAGTLVFYKNNTSQGTAYSNLTANATWTPAMSMYGNVAVSANFGQRPFAISSVPTGHLALCTTNLPDPTIADGSDYFDVKTYAGNAGTQSITGLEFSPDFVWIKARNHVVNHILTDIIRGTSKELNSNTNGAENDQSGYGLTAFNSDGFTVKDTNGGYGVNGSYNYVAWTWDGGTSTVSNTDGSITSSVRANPSAGFSIVTWTANGSTATIGHGLGVSPGMIISKNRTSSTTDWSVYHSSLGKDQYLALDKTNAADTVSNFWGSVTPGSTTFGVLTGRYDAISGNDIVAYCFAPVDGYSAFGSYTGNGSADGPFVFTGFRPRWIVCKPSSTTGAWQINDAARNTYNVVDSQLFADFSNAESTTADRYVDFLSNGFKLRGNNASLNGSGSTYIYAAFAEHPQKTARAR